MLTTPTRTHRPSRGVIERDRRRARDHAARLNVGDIELLLDAIGDREDRATAAERARLGRIRAAVELDLADLLGR